MRILLCAALCLWPALAWGSPITYEFNFGLSSGGSITGEFTVKNNAESTGQFSTLRNTQSIPVQKFSYTIDPQWTSTFHDIGALPTVSGSLWLSSYCSGACVFLGSQTTPFTMIRLTDGKYNAQLVWNGHFESLYQPGTNFSYWPEGMGVGKSGVGLNVVSASVIARQPGHSAQANSVPEPETVWLFLGGIGALVVLLTWQEARRP